MTVGNGVGVLVGFRVGVGVVVSFFVSASVGFTPLTVVLVPAIIGVLVAPTRIKEAIIIPPKRSAVDLRVVTRSFAKKDGLTMLIKKATIDARKIIVNKSDIVLWQRVESRFSGIITHIKSMPKKNGGVLASQF